MAKLLKLRRGTTSEHSSFTGAEGEVTIDTTKDTAVVHDGSTAGGHPLVKENAEVTSTGIASDVVDEDNLKVSNTPTNGQFLQAQSGASGGLTWATVNSTPEGTAVISTGETTVGKFLRTDGDGTCSWTTDAGNLTNITPANISSGSLPNGVVATAAALTGTATGVNLTLSGDLTVNGTTTTVASTNTTLTDNLIELNSGASSNANDAGILIERGSTGDNAIIAWDESADKFTVGTTTATASDTGDLTVTPGTLIANLEGDVNGTAGVASTITTAVEASDTSCNVVFTTAATGDLPPKTSTGLTFDSQTGQLNANYFAGDGSSLTNLNVTPTSPAGSNYQVQYNNNGAFGSNAWVYIYNNILHADQGLKDGLGNVREVPATYFYTNWTVGASHIGKSLLCQGSFYVGTASAGAIVTCVNDTSSDITINRSTSYLYNTASGDNNSSYTLASRGMVTLWYAASSTVYMSGSGVS